MIYRFHLQGSEPLRSDRLVAQKRRQGIIILRCVRSQERADLIDIATEVRYHDLTLVKTVKRNTKLRSDYISG